MKPNARIHIVEDEMIIATDLQDMLQELGYEVTGISSSYEEAFESIKRLKPTLIFLDIIIRGKRSGIDLAQAIQDSENPIPFIFLTSHADKSTLEQAKRTKPYAYLVKPFEQKDVFAATEMSLSRVEDEKIRQHVVIPDGKGKAMVLLEDILYAQAEGNYTLIKTEKKIFSLRRTLKETIESLLFDKIFTRIHKSYLVNRAAISKINAQEVILINAETLPIGRVYAQELKRELMQGSV